MDRREILEKVARGELSPEEADDLLRRPDEPTLPGSSVSKVVIRARLSAGPLTLEDFEGPLDLSVNAGAIRANGRLTSGDSRIRSDAGAVRVELDPASSVHITANAALGKVVLLSEDGPRAG